ncbi:MAG: hypothetical protein ACR2NZ_08190 [Rubripirellula sp.]
MPQPSNTDRRRFFIASGAIAASVVAGSQSHAADPGILLRPGNRDLVRVRIELEVKGNVNIPKNSLVSRQSSVKLPIQSDAVFDYEERYRRSPGAQPGSVVTAVERYYHEAKNRSQLNQSSHTQTLRDSVRETVVRRDSLPEVIYGVEDFFERDELELLRLPASSVAADELLPGEKVVVGSKYRPDAQALMSVLNLTSVAATDVEAEVVSITDDAAKIQFKGKVDGSVDGVPTVIRTIGKLTFDRTVGTCTWLAMALHETREIGKAEPGFDVAATIKMIRKPLDATIALAATPPEMEVADAIPSDRLYVALQSDQLDLRVLMDRRWRMMKDLPGAAMMRMIENDRSIGQCDFRPLTSLSEGEQWTLQAFQADVQGILGEQLDEFVEAEEQVSQSGMRVLRIVANGAVEGVPIRWVLLHLSDDSGRRILATFTMEGQNIDAFAGSDMQLAGTLRFNGSEQENKSSPKEVALNSASCEANPRVAEAISDANSATQVQSTNELR